MWARLRCRVSGCSSIDQHSTGISQSHTARHQIRDNVAGHTELAACLLDPCDPGTFVTHGGLGNLAHLRLRGDIRLHLRASRHARAAEEHWHRLRNRRFHGHCPFQRRLGRFSIVLDLGFGCARGVGHGWILFGLGSRGGAAADQFTGEHR